MKKTAFAACALFLALPLSAQNWSVGVGTGAFAFGDFVQRKVRPAAGDIPAGTITMTLSAKTRPGLAVDVERALSDRWAVRLEGAFTHAPLAVSQEGRGGVGLDAGTLDVATFMLPIVFRINRGGAFRFHVMAGPAQATYRLKGRSTSVGSVPLFTGTRAEWGGAAGAGIAWAASNRFAVEGNITDILTTSPFHDDDFPNVPGFKIKQPHNVHTTVGVRWRF